ncbi:MAG TPA: thiamine phosphate synthase, partial [Marinagarivorans sp.]|nr:thiamine phosphate synthase [Marinagarivorans sp.]
YRVTQFDGVAQGREGQPLVWIKPSELNNYPFPAANRPIVQALMLPQQLCITGAAATPAIWSERFAQSLQPNTWMLARPQNEEQLSWPWPQLIIDAFSLCQRHNTRLLLHSSLLLKMAPGFNGLGPEEQRNLLQQYCHGVHLTAAAAADQLLCIPTDFPLGMSCHTEQELAKAHALNCHYALLSPALPTQTHADAAPLGWSEFTRLCRLAKVPVFALGGIDARHRGLAQSLGAQGVAGIRGFWGINSTGAGDNT